MQPRDDNEQQATFREKRNVLWKKWAKAGMLNYKLVWSAHDPDNKIAMCREAMTNIGWSVSVYDTRMEDHVATVRRRNKLKRQRKRMRGDASSGESGAEDSGASTRTPKKLPCKADRAEAQEPPTPDDSKIASYPPKARISLVDADQVPMAHGTIVDDEPEIPEDDTEECMDGNKWTKFHKDLPDCSTGSFKRVRISSLVRYVVHVTSHMTGLACLLLSSRSFCLFASDVVI